MNKSKSHPTENRPKAEKGDLFLPLNSAARHVLNKALVSLATLYYDGITANVIKII